LSTKDVYIHFIDDCSRSVEENATLLKIKGKNFNKALVCFCIALFSFVMSMSEGRWFAMSTNTVSNQFNLLRSEQSVRTATSQQRSSNRDSSGIIPDRKPTTLNITKGITPEKK
jgi:hypothetical protein